MKTLYELPEWINEAITEHRQDVENFIDGALPADEFKARRVPRGVYEQRRDNTYMVRVRVAGGVLLSEQARQLAAIKRRYSGTRLYLTTRQEFQYHNVKLEDTPEIMESLLEVGLASMGGGGNTVRNIMACSGVGLCPGAMFPVAPYSAAVTEYLINLPEAYTLPRKYKVAFSGCEGNCALATTTDLGFVATSRDGKAGFRVYGGGGLGSAPRIGDLLVDFLPASEAVCAAEAGRRLFDRIGDRTNRNRARLRHAVRRVGAEVFKETFLKELEKARNDTLIPRLDKAGISELNIPQVKTAATFQGYTRDILQDVQTSQCKKNDRAAFTVPSVQGTVSADLLDAVADCSEQYSEQNVILLTRRQDLAIPGVSHLALENLAAALSGAIVYPTAYPQSKSFTACTGASTCRLGICLAKNAAAAAAVHLAVSDIDPRTIADVDIRISGCHNSCAQHQVADIGLFGGARKCGPGHIPGYQVLLGGGHHENDTRFGQLFGFVPAKALPSFLAEVLRFFAQKRCKNESFKSLMERLGMEIWKSELADFHELPDRETSPDYYRDWYCDADFVPGGDIEGQCGAATPFLQSNPEDRREQMDLRGVPCPLNFARARSAINEMKAGNSKTFLLDDGQPVTNVVKSFRNEGFVVDDETRQSDGSWLIRVHK